MHIMFNTVEIKNKTYRRGLNKYLIAFEAFLCESMACGVTLLQVTNRYKKRLWPLGFISRISQRFFLEIYNNFQVCMYVPGK